MRLRAWLEYEKVIPSSVTTVLVTENRPETKCTRWMQIPELPDCAHFAFKNHLPIPNAGLLLPITLSTTWVWMNWFSAMLIRALRRVGPTLATAAQANGDCVDGAYVLQTGGTPDAICCLANEPSI